MRAAYRGFHVDTIAANVVGEYFERQSLAKLGFTSPLGELDVEKAAQFILIEHEIEKIREEERKKKPRKG